MAWRGSKIRGETSPSRPWWEASKADVGAALISQTSKLKTNQQGITNRNYRSALLYGGQAFFSTGRFSPASIGAGLSQIGNMTRGAYSSPRYNLIYSMVQTVMARQVSGGMPAVAVVTNEGDWDLQNKAEMLDQAIEGLVYLTRTELEALKALKDCLVFGTGGVKAWTDRANNVKVMRFYPETVWTEMYDGRDGRPRTIYMMDYVDRDVLAWCYPDSKKDISNSRPPEETGQSTDILGTRQIPYFESWHLPSGEGAGDGRHILCIAGKVIVDDQWTQDEFPLAFIRFDESLTGFYGRGISELLYPHQAALSAIQKAEYHAWSQVGLPRLWVNINSKINEDNLMSSRSGNIVRGIGDPPQVLNWTGTHPDLPMYKDWIIKSAYEFIGVSQMSSSGMKPAGLDSGAAQREYMDIQNDRFSILSEAWQKFWMDIGLLLIRTAKQAYDKDSAFSVPVIGKSFLSEIKWSKVNMKADAFRLKCYPISSLPRSPAARFAAIQEMLQAQLITREEGLKLLKFPDLDDTLSLENSMQDYARRVAYEVLRLGMNPTPEPMARMDLAIPVWQKEAVRAMNGGMSQSDPRITKIRNLIARAKTMIQPPAPAMPTPGGGGPALAQGAPLPQQAMMPFKQSA